MTDLQTPGTVGDMPYASAADVNACPIRFAHLSDSHLGFTQYPALAANGRPQRESDLIAAFKRTVEDICAWDPPLVIHAGDMFDRPVIPTRIQAIAQHAFTALTTRPDGSMRPLVIISGNHDQPRDPREPAALELDRPIRGMYITTTGIGHLDGATLVADGADPALANLHIVTVPHDSLAGADFTDITTVDGKTNILVSHAVVGGTELYRRTRGRENFLPIDVATRGWTYVAMGHWHLRTAVAVGGYSEATTPIWYCGSSENNGFADVVGADGSHGRGYLKVGLPAADQPPLVAGVDLPVRAMFRLPAVDANSKDADELITELVENIRSADITGAVVSQTITGIDRDMWNLLDIGAVRKHAGAAVWYELRPLFTDADTADLDHGDPLADLGDVIDSVAAATIAEEKMRGEAVALARDLLGAALAAPVDDTGDKLVSVAA